MNQSGLSLKAVLALCFGLMAIILTICLSGLIGHYASLHDKAAAESRLDDLADVTVAMLDRGMHERLHDIFAFANAGPWRTTDSPEAQRQQLENLRMASPDVRWLGVTDLQGRMLYATEPALEGQDFSQQQRFREGRQGLFLSAIHRGARPTDRVLDVSLLLVQADGEPVGVLMAELSWDWARPLERQLLTEARQSAGLEIIVADAQGRVLLAPPAYSRLRLPALAGLGPAKPLRWPDGRDYLTSLRQSRGIQEASGLSWSVITRQPLDRAFAAVSNLQRYLWLAGLGSAALFALLGLALANVLSRPLTQLAKAADLLRQGEADSLPPARRGFRESRQLGQSLSALMHSLQARERELASLNASLEQQVLDRTLLIEKANQHLMGVLEERLRLQKQLEEQASTDSLTGLLNRRAFDQRAGLELSRVERGGQSFSVLTFDIDHFKRVNDSFGHDRGDEVLKACAETCRKELRDTDICARFGGEEFVLLLPDTNADGARQLAERLRERMAALTIESPQGPIQFTASFGVAPHLRGQPLSLTLQQADQALYAAKHSGRNRVVVFF